MFFETTIAAMVVTDNDDNYSNDDDSDIEIIVGNSEDTKTITMLTTVVPLTMKIVITVMINTYCSENYGGNTMMMVW